MILTRHARPDLLTISSTMSHELNGNRSYDTMAVKIEDLLRGACGAAFQWVGMAQTTLKTGDGSERSLKG